MDLQPVFAAMDAGAEYWRNFLSEYQICSRDFVVIMAAERKDFHYFTLKFLCGLKEEKNADRIYVLHTEELSSAYIEETVSVQVEDVVCTGQEMWDLCRLSYLYPFSEQVIFNTYKGVCDCDGSLLLGCRGLTVQELVAVSLLGLSRVPEVLEQEKEETGNAYKRIDWTKEDALVKTGRIRISSNTDREEMIRERVYRLTADKTITEKDRIVLFGVTSSSMLVKELLKGFCIVAFVDNDRRKNGRKIDGIPVYAPDDFLKDYDAGIKIIVVSRSFHPMCEQLFQYGYEINSQVFVVYFRYNYYDVLPETIRYYKNEITEGEQIYAILTGGKRSIFLCPYPGTGDIYLAGIYLKGYIQQNDLKDYVVVVCSAGCKKVAEMFGYAVEVVSEEDCRKLIAFSRMVGFDKSGLHILNDSFENSNCLIRLRGYRGIDFNTMFARCVFRMKRLSAPEKIPIVNSDELFARYHLKRGKTVLLSPYANTMHLLSGEFWKQLAGKLTDAGYSVCTNVASDDEKAVSGTVGIFISYKMVVDFLNQAGYFIGLRSGLCDIVSCTNAKLCVLYQRDMMFGGGTLFDYFSLERMGLRNNDLLELEYDLEDMDGIMAEIVGAII